MSGGRTPDGTAELGWHLRGYVAPFHALGGEAVDVFVHGEEPSVTLDVVRLVDGPTATGGLPQFEAAADFPPVRCHCTRQVTPFGSYAWVPTARRQVPRIGTAAVWVWPTLPAAGRVQGLMGFGASACGLGLALDEHGALAAVRWHADDIEVLMRMECPLRSRCWTLVALCLDPFAPTGGITLHAAGVDRVGTGTLPAVDLHADDSGITLGALMCEALRRPPAAPFNGKLEDPALWSQPLSPDELAALDRGGHPSEVSRRRLLAAWDFSIGIASDVIRDVGPRELHGHLVQRPSRGVVGRLWTGDEHDFRVAPRHYSAIHFHDDDLEDSAWTRTSRIAIPRSWRSGVYAARVTGADETTLLPFVIEPNPDEMPEDGSSPVAVLLPTFTYLAYANSLNEHQLAWREGVVGVFEALVAREHRSHLGPSLYDRHHDGSPVYHATWRKPIAELRPDYRFWRTGLPRHFSLDVSIVGWLGRQGLQPDVITDDLLDEYGMRLLRRYRVLVTGCHPEYVSPAIREALTEFVERGGRLMYLGGNGFHWSVSRARAAPHMLELRRGFGAWNAPSWVGECHEASTGQLGGRWSARGAAAQSLTGVGTTALGWSRGAPYRLTGAGPSWLIDALRVAGVDGIVGASGATAFGGPAGDEIDRFDAGLGSPPDAVVVATSHGLHDKGYEALAEDFETVGDGPPTSRRVRDLVRSDLTLRTLDSGGAVFSVGSVAWALGLLRGVEDPAVDRLTAAVLQQFLGDEPLGDPVGSVVSAEVESGRELPAALADGRRSDAAAPSFD